jgi:integrase
MKKTPRRRGLQDGVFQKPNGWWYLDYYDTEGRRHRTKASLSYEVARQMYRKTRVDLDRGEVTGLRDEGLLFRDFALTTWLPLACPRLSPLWGEHVGQTVRALLIPTFGHRPLAQLTAKDVEAWAAERRQQVGPSTFNKNVWVLKNILTLARKRGHLRQNPAEDLKRRKESSGRVRYLEHGERGMLLDAANPELAAYILVALETGGRRSELCRLTWADLDMKQKLVAFRQTKNGETRHVPMTDTIYAFLQTLPRPLGSSVPVLPAYDDPHSITQAFDRLVKRLGLKNLTFHDTRHDFASRLAQAGVPLLTIGKLLGHKSMVMTMRYAHLSPEHLREAVQALARAVMADPTTAKR